MTAILDRLLVLGCTYLRLGADAQARDVLAALQRAFEIGFDESEVARGATDARAPRLWLEVAEPGRVDRIGGLGRDTGETQLLVGHSRCGVPRHSVRP